MVGASLGISLDFRTSFRSILTSPIISTSTSNYEDFPRSQRPCGSCFRSWRPPGATQVWAPPGSLVSDFAWRWYGPVDPSHTLETRADHGIFCAPGGTQADSVFSGISTFGRLEYHKCLANEDIKYGAYNAAWHLYQSTRTWADSYCQTSHSLGYVHMQHLANRHLWTRLTAMLVRDQAPFDTGTSYRPGARFGPSGIRQGSRRLNL